MRKLFPVFLSLLLLALTFSVTGSVLANTPALIPGPTPLTGRQGEYPLGPHGTLGPFANRDIPHYYLIFTLCPSSQTEQTFYLRFQSNNSLILPLILRRVTLLWSQNMVQYLLSPLPLPNFISGGKTCDDHHNGC